MHDAQKGEKMRHFTMDCFDEAIAEVITARVLKKVLEAIKTQDESVTLEKAEQVVVDYFEGKVFARFDSDRIFFLKLPYELQKIIPDEETYGMIHNAYTDSFWAGYQAGLQDMQELEREIDISTQESPINE